jgi:hypothetical protein
MRERGQGRNQGGKFESNEGTSGVSEEDDGTTDEEEGEVPSRSTPGTTFKEPL